MKIVFVSWFQGQYFTLSFCVYLVIMCEKGAGLPLAETVCDAFWWDYFLVLKAHKLQQAGHQGAMLTEYAKACLTSAQDNRLKSQTKLNEPWFDSNGHHVKIMWIKTVILMWGFQKLFECFCARTCSLPCSQRLLRCQRYEPPSQETIREH